MTYDLAQLVNQLPYNLCSSKLRAQLLTQLLSQDLAALTASQRKLLRQLPIRAKKQLLLRSKNNQKLKIELWNLFSFAIKQSFVISHNEKENIKNQIRVASATLEEISEKKLKDEIPLALLEIE